MAKKDSAHKRHKQSQRNRLRNRIMKSVIKSKTKKVLADGQEAEKEFRELTSLLDKAARKRVLHPNTASRRKSRLAKALNKKKSAE